MRVAWEKLQRSNALLLWKRYRFWRWCLCLNTRVGKAKERRCEIIVAEK